MRRQNTAFLRRRGFLTALVAFILLIVLMSLPLYEFTSAVYSKRICNTFAGDERYEAAKTEAEAMLEAHVRDTGRHAELREESLERVNSKGETTTMITLTVEERQQRNGWQFMLAPLAAGREMLILFLCALTALLLILPAARKTEQPAARKPLAVRGAAAWLALVALLLVPVFVLTCSVEFIRRVNIAAGGFADETATLRAIDSFLYGGGSGDSILSLASGMKLTVLWPVWLLAPVLATHKVPSDIAVGFLFSDHILGIAPAPG